jgi:transglutaminase-like putative cysteine protease
MRLSIRHVSTFAFDSPVDRCALRLRLYPSTFNGQKPKSWSVTANGKSVAPLLTTGFGDKQAIWTCDQSASELEIVAAGDVETTDVAGFVKGLKEAARPGVFLRPTPLTTADAKIEALAKSIAGTSTLEKMHALCSAVRDAIEPRGPKEGETRPNAAHALKAGEGTSADHAHVFISAAHALDVPARFIVGYLFAPEEKQTEPHAWAEAYVPELGWVGFDPFSRLCPTERYVRLASGLDSADAAPLRGGAGGRAQDKLAATVLVEEAIQSQSQQQ